MRRGRSSAVARGATGGAGGAGAWGFRHAPGILRRGCHRSETIPVASIHPCVHGGETGRLRPARRADAGLPYSWEKRSLATAHWPPAAKRAAARSDWLLVGAIVVYLLANLPFLVAWPAVNGDEGREANAFWVASGVDPSAQTLDPVFRHDPLYKGGLQGLTTGVSFRLFGLGTVPGAARLADLGRAAAGDDVPGRPPPLRSGRRRHRGAVPGGLAAVAGLVAHHPTGHRRRDAGDGRALLRPPRPAGGRPAVAPGGGALPRALVRRPPELAGVHADGRPVLRRAVRLASGPRPGCLAVRRPGIAIGALYYVAVRVAPDPMHFLEAFQYWIGVDKRPPALATRGGSPIEAELGPLDRSTSATAGWRRALLGLGVVTAAIRMVRQRRARPACWSGWSPRSSSSSSWSAARPSST